jgi:tripartite-type tricarboxylate transporter receptor subunit TctC
VRRMHISGIVMAGLVLGAAMAGPAAAQALVPFYKGKTIHLVISTGVAGGYAAYARPLAAHMGDHIAGAPSFVVESMSGAGGLIATNYLYNQAPQDGTYMGIVHSSIPLAPLWGTKGVRFDTLKFNWVGSLDRAAGMCIAWRDAPIKTWADMLDKEFTVGSSGVGSQMDTYPAILNRLFGTRIKVIGGYKDGTDVYLAMQRGEVEGRCGGQLAVIKSTLPDWLTQHKFNVPIVIAAKRIPEFPDTPSVMEFVKDEAARQQLDLLDVSQALDRPVMLPPGVPAERVEEIRAAFDATMRDPGFLADIGKERLEVDPVRGVDMANDLARAFALPAEIIAGAREMMGSGE